jgi:hypothetical protein
MTLFLNLLGKKDGLFRGQKGQGFWGGNFSYGSCRPC